MLSQMSKKESFGDLQRLTKCKNVRDIPPPPLPPPPPKPPPPPEIWKINDAPTVQIAENVIK